MKVVREIVKLFMYVTIWAIPTATAFWFDKGAYLYLYIVSFIVTVGIFNHYSGTDENE